MCSGSYLCLRGAVGSLACQVWITRCIVAGVCVDTFERGLGVCICKMSTIYVRARARVCVCVCVCVWRVAHQSCTGGGGARQESCSRFRCGGFAWCSSGGLIADSHCSASNSCAGGTFPSWASVKNGLSSCTCLTRASWIVTRYKSSWTC